MKEKKGGN